MPWFVMRFFEILRLFKLSKDPTRIIKSQQPNTRDEIANINPGKSTHHLITEKS